MKILANRVLGTTACVVTLLSPGVPATAAEQRPSDENIGYWVREGLREDPRVWASDITVAVADGVVTLKGFVTNLAEKKYADLEAKKIKGVRGVVNEITVSGVSRPDAELMADVNRRLKASSSLHSESVQAKVASGSVTLTGSMASWARREEAELVATEVRGTKDVKNEIQVRHESKRPDKDVQTDVKGSLDRDVYLAGLPITVSVNDGMVALDGMVGSAYQKERAGRDAQFVANVKKVENNLKVEWWEKRGTREAMPVPSDPDLAMAVKATLDHDNRLQASMVTTAARGGHVTLRGTVPTDAQARTAESDAMEVPGSVWVSNLLDVSPMNVADEKVLEDVRFALDTDALMQQRDLAVHVTNGFVSLSGTVRNSFQRSHAADVVSRVHGVRGVENGLTVNWVPRFHDAALAERIVERLGANWETRWVADSIRVQVHGGVATLTGDVNTWSERHEAGRLAYLTDGIWSVVNKVRVRNVEYPWELWEMGEPNPFGLYLPHPPVYYDRY